MKKKIKFSYLEGFQGNVILFFYIYGIHYKNWKT